PSDNGPHASHGTDVRWVLRMPKHNWNGILVIGSAPGTQNEYFGDRPLSDYLLMNHYAYFGWNKGMLNKTLMSTYANWSRAGLPSGTPLHLGQVVGGFQLTSGGTDVHPDDPAACLSAHPYLNSDVLPDYVPDTSPGYFGRVKSANTFIHLYGNEIVSPDPYD